MVKKKYRVFDRAVKIDTVKRMLRGENVSALTRELKISRAVLYRWKDEYRQDGSNAFRRRAGRPPKSSPVVDRARAEAAGELAAARHRVAELERKIGQQQVELDFFRQALRQVGADSAAMRGRGAKTSTPSSKR
ncbi:MAG: transposase [Burkholderiales bacterium]